MEMAQCLFDPGFWYDKLKRDVSKFLPKTIVNVHQNILDKKEVC